MNGYWVFHAPPGYKYEKVEGHGKLLVRNEPLASIIQEALEGFASGRFETQSEVKRFLESQPDFPKDFADGTIRYEKVVRLFRRVHYAGYIEAPDWDVSLRKGHHEGLISLETFEKIQSRALKKARVHLPEKTSVRISHFAALLTCGDCSKPLTANWSKSKTGKKHPYYMCFSKGCESYRKSIRRDVLEGEFDALVHSLQPERGLFACAKAMFKQAWNQRLAQSQVITHTLKRDITKIEKQMETLLDRLVDTTTPTAVIAYETRLEKLERDKLVLIEKTREKPTKYGTFDDLFELAVSFLSSPWILWQTGSLTLKKTVLRLAFSERVAYCRKQGLRTPKTSLPFKVLWDSNPRYACTHAGFQDRCIRPLCHLSGRVVHVGFRCAIRWGNSREKMVVYGFLM